MQFVKVEDGKPVFTPEQLNELRALAVPIQHWLKHHANPHTDVLVGTTDAIVLASIAAISKEKSDSRTSP